jgi:site-specific recombinase XerD
MINRIYVCQHVLTRLKRNPCWSVLNEYVAQLQIRGYTRNTIRNSVGVVEHFGLWMKAQRLSLSKINLDLVHSFLHEHLPKCRCPRPSPNKLVMARPALNYLLQLLRDRKGSCAKPGARLRSYTGTVLVKCMDRMVPVLDAYSHHLRETRGLAQATIRAHLYFAQKFLEKTFGTGALRWHTLRTNDVLSFVTDYTKRWRPASAKGVICSLRSFLRYLQIQGWCEPLLIAVLPCLPTWRLDRLPRVMTDEQMNAFLAAFDRSTAVGRRDYAMALCQIELGLRACEVAALRLDDIDWRSATLRTVGSKIGRGRELPLPARAGRAMAEYLRRGRPTTHSRQFFVRHRILHGTPLNTAVIQDAMSRAYAQVPGCEHWVGTHALRHTAATRLYRRGAKLKEVADLLGHRSLDTTAIYTKVDLPRLSKVALPWPEAKS